MTPHVISQRFLYDLRESVIGSWVHSDLAEARSFFQRVCLQEKASPAVHSIALPCSESLPHKSVKKGKSIMTYYCLPPMLRELALVGGENVFLQKPGDWEKPTLQWATDCSARFHWAAIDQCRSNGFGRFRVAVFFSSSNKMSWIFLTIGGINWSGTGCFLYCNFGRLECI